MEKLNVLFIVWDACRADYIDFAPNASSLAADNVQYSNAISPATWSLPAHVSMFTGQQVHNHGIFNRVKHTIGSVSLVDSLHEEGYQTYGVSANPFASPYFDFDKSFDQFHYTNGTDITDVTGLDVHSILEEYGRGGWGRAAMHTLGHENTRGSIQNLMHTLVGKTVEHIQPLRRVPHPWFTGGGTFGYSYRPDWNTSLIESILTEEANRDRPFFLFTNYMDPHHPYSPPRKFRDTVSSELSPHKIYELNEEYGQPWTFLKQQLSGGDVSDVVLEQLRDLYAGEVTSVDEHLGRLLDLLECLDLAEDTVVILTADHGELLGEHDRSGRQRIGHEATVDDAVAEVPLIVAHPSLPPERVTERVSLLEIPQMIKSFTAGITSEMLPERDGVTLCASPAHGGKEVFEAFDVPHEVLAQAVTVHTIAGYDDNWKVVVDSKGDRYVERDGQRRHISEAPNALVEECEDALSKLITQDEIDRIDNDSLPRSQLEDLGYL